MAKTKVTRLADSEPGNTTAVAIRLMIDVINVEKVDLGSIVKHDGGGLVDVLARIVKVSGDRLRYHANWCFKSLAPIIC